MSDLSNNKKLSLTLPKLSIALSIEVNRLVLIQKPKLKGTIRNMSYNDAEEILNQFVLELYLQTQGNSSNTVSWYDIGETLGLDRKGSSQAAEKIIGTGLAEIKTLNGGITITNDGIDEAHKLGAD
jgi:hypothetical protein